VFECLRILFSSACSGSSADDVVGKLSSTSIRQWKSMNHFLNDHWKDLSSKLEIPAAVSLKWWKKLNQCYSEPQRFYHTLFHIESLLRVYSIDMSEIIELYSALRVKLIQVELSKHCSIVNLVPRCNLSAQES
jgi:hypothetical protein